MSRFKREDGAIFVHVSIAIVALLMISGIVIDQGVMMVARAQVQAAADGGALAGATAFVYDNDEGTDDGPAKTAAYQFALRTGIWGEQGDVTDPTKGDATDVKFFDDDPDSFPAECEDAKCIRVDVYRNQLRQNGIPLVGFRTFGLTQGVRATAIARAANANYSNCLKPWLIPDKFTDLNGNGTYDEGEYTNPGYTEADIGTELVLSADQGPGNQLAPSNFFHLLQGNSYPPAITGCTLQAGIGDTLETFPGGAFGLTIPNVKELTKDGPVTVVVGMFSPVEWAALPHEPGKQYMTMVNMMGFRITGMQGRKLVGTIVAAPGEIVGTSPGASEGSSFLKVIQLVR
jgi:hypothetical protein